MAKFNKRSPRTGLYWFLVARVHGACLLAELNLSFTAESRMTGPITSAA